jgi:enoyl-CoA hydratase
MLLTGDVRIGADNPKAKVGMNEVAIGMSVPILAVELARHRMPGEYLSRATTMAEIFKVEDAAKAGYYDRVVPADELESTAMEEAKRLGQLQNPGFKNTKMFERGDIIHKIQSSFPREMARMSGKKSRL